MILSLFKRFNGSIGYSVPDPNNPLNSINASIGFTPEAPLTVSEYEAMKKLKEEFSEEVAKIIALSGKEKFILAIDELDRCRPDYAIRTLETIKHFFDIKGLTIIFTVEKEQIQNTVKAMYGIDTNTDGYLRKFIDIEYALAEPDLITYVKHLFNKHTLLTKKLVYYFDYKKVLYRNDNTNSWYVGSPHYWSYIGIFIDFVQNYDLELRDIEKIMLRLDLVITPSAFCS